MKARRGKGIRPGRRAAAIGLAIMSASAFAGCQSVSVAPSPQVAAADRSVTHKVAAGDTVYRIASHYGISTKRLMEANGLSDPRELHVGQTLTIPGAYQAASLGAAFSSVHPYMGERSSRQFLWPVSQGMVSSGFGIRGGAMHDGVDIAAPAGTPVHAADSGVVIFSGTLHGYGNTVIIRHDLSYATVYGHHSRNLVREGDRVARGQTIGAIGHTGRTTGANLHFEVRRDNVAKDPLAYLPQPTPTSGISFAAAGGS